MQQVAQFDWLKVPCVTGCDVAGEVIEVGNGVTRFEKGDRVMEMTIGQMLNKPSKGGFQLYSIVEANWEDHSRLRRWLRGLIKRDAARYCWRL